MALSTWLANLASRSGAPPSPFTRAERTRSTDSHGAFPVSHARWPAS